jgi:hypothetical protein
MLMLKKTTPRPRKLKQLVIDRIDLVTQGANPDANILLFKSQEGDQVGKLDVGAGTPILTLEQRQQARQLWQIWGDFCDTVYALMDYHEDGDPVAQAQALLTSIDQFHAQAQDLLSSLGLLSKMASHFKALRQVAGAVQKAGAIMSAARRQRLQAAVEALQAILDESAPKEAADTSKGARMTAYDEMQRLAKNKLERKECPTMEQAIVQVAAERPDLRAQYRREPRPMPVVKGEEAPAKHWSLVQMEALAQEMRRHQPRLTKEAAIVRVMKETARGRELAAAYREHQREVARG